MAEGHDVGAGEHVAREQSRQDGVDDVVAGTAGATGRAGSRYPIAPSALSRTTVRSEYGFAAPCT